MMRRKAGLGLATAALALFLAMAGSLGGCSSLQIAVGAGATVGVATVEERGPKQAAIDTGIEIKISARLLQKDGRLFAKIGVTCIEGRVLLTGVVATPGLRADAQNVAASVAGVRAVIDEIQVHAAGDFGDYTHDAWISTELRADLLTDRKIADVNYSITTVDGTIYLFGIAQNQAEIDRVIAYARAIPGVRRIVDQVLIKGDKRLLPPR